MLLNYFIGGLFNCFETAILFTVYDRNKCHQNKSAICRLSSVQFIDLRAAQSKSIKLISCTSYSLGGYTFYRLFVIEITRSSSQPREKNLGKTCTKCLPQQYTCGYTVVKYIYIYIEKTPSNLHMKHGSKSCLKTCFKICKIIHVYTLRLRSIF